MFTVMFLVYAGPNRNDVKALFKAESDATNYAQPNGWTVEECRVPVPFTALVEIPVFPE